MFDTLNSISKENQTVLSEESDDYQQPMVTGAIQNFTYQFDSDPEDVEDEEAVHMKFQSI